MQSATVTCMSSAVAPRATARPSRVARHPICTNARLSCERRVFNGQRNLRSQAVRSPWSVGGRCGPTFELRWGGIPDMQRPFYNSAEQASNGMRLNVDIEETSQEYSFVADIPGLGKKDIKVQMNKACELSISGERRPRSSSADPSPSGTTWRVLARKAARQSRKSTKDNRRGALACLRGLGSCLKMQIHRRSRLQSSRAC